MIALCVPFYMYIQESIANLKTQELSRVKKETADIKLNVCITGDIEKVIFYREKYKIAFYDKNGKIIHTNDDTFNFKNYEVESGFDGNDVFSYLYLEKERNGAVKFIVIESIDYSEILIKVALLALYILIFLLLSSGALIYFSTKTLSQTNVYLAQFFNDAMHEIRTPLGIIQFNLDMLKDKVKESNLPIFNRTQAATKSLTSIYEDIEYFIKYKKVNYQTEIINISDFLENRVNFFEVLANIKEINFKTDIQSDIKYPFNRIELQRLIDNNISNAIKYSKEKTTISILLKKIEDDIYLTFEDEGRGIEDISKIFVRYYRGDEIKGGFGMGLSIVKEICKKYNIKVEVTSEVKKGSKFTYILKNS
jgi:signal transduction histidine kinase